MCHTRTAAAGDPYGWRMADHDWVDWALKLIALLTFLATAAAAWLALYSVRRTNAALLRERKASFELQTLARVASPAGRQALDVRSRTARYHDVAITELVQASALRAWDILCYASPAHDLGSLIAGTAGRRLTNCRPRHAGDHALINFDWDPAKLALVDVYYPFVAAWRLED